MEKVPTGRGSRVWRWEIIAPDGSIVPTGSTETEAPFRRWAIHSAKRFLAKHLQSLEQETAAQGRR
jgi:hypothetical protein